MFAKCTFYGNFNVDGRDFTKKSYVGNVSQRNQMLEIEMFAECTFLNILEQN